jgi:hypothetical protein
MKNLNDLREQALAVINRDVGRMVSNPTPVYRGKTSVPMSVLTQKKRTLEDQFNSSPAPYSLEASGVLSRTPQGFNGYTFIRSKTGRRYRMEADGKTVWR